MLASVLEQLLSDPCHFDHWTLFWAPYFQMSFQMKTGSVRDNETGIDHQGLTS